MVRHLTLILDAVPLSNSPSLLAELLSTVLFSLACCSHSWQWTNIIQVFTSKRSLPSVHAPAFDEALRMKFQFVFSKTDTYWSTFETMCMYVTDILVPFWMQKKEELGAPPDQPCILQLDCWVVHRSVAFRTWLDTTYNWIRYRFVPAGTTGVAQPCDVGLQRPIKLTIKELQHEDIVNETLMQLSSGTVPSEVRLDVTKGTLRDRSVRWFVEAYKAVNKTDLIKKAFALCKAGENDQYNLSFECLTSVDTLRTLRDLPRTDPDMWQQILPRSIAPNVSATLIDDVNTPLPEEEVDESGNVNDEAPLEVVIEHVMSGKKYVREGYIIGPDGSLMVDGAADEHHSIGGDVEGTGRGKRQRIPNTQYGNYHAH